MTPSELARKMGRDAFSEGVAMDHNADLLFKDLAGDGSDIWLVSDWYRGWEDGWKASR